MAKNMPLAGVGTKFYRQNPDTSEWEVISRIMNISGPGMSRETIDITSLDSLGGYREFITGFRDGGEISMSMIFTHDGYAALKADFESNIVNHYKIVLPNEEQSIFAFDGLVTGCPVNIPPDDKIGADTTIKISGMVEFYSGSTTVTT